MRQVSVETRTETSRDDYHTPKPFLESIQEAIGAKFDFDYCAQSDWVAPVWTDDLESFLSDTTDSGFGAPLLGWCNPPFSKAKTLIPKLIEYVKAKNVGLVCLLPVRPDTAFWQDVVLNYRVIFLRGRVNFVLPDGSKPKNGAAFPVCLVCINLYRHEISALTAKLGRLYEPHS